MSKLLVGFAEESLMHEKRIRLGGQFYERISDGVESEITAIKPQLQPFVNSHFS